MTFFDCFLCLIIRYLIGGFSTAITLSILVQHHDIRKTGSGNAGATNMLRSYGWRAGPFTFFIDVLKGFLATYIGLRLYSEIGAVLCGTAAVIRHTYPLYYGFKGGKGIATSLGVLFAVEWEFATICLVFWIVLVLLTRMVSIGSIMASVLYPVLVLVKGEAFSNRWIYLAFSVVLAMLD